MYYPENLDVMMAGVHAFVASQTTARVVWGEQDAPVPAKPFVRIEMLVPPVADRQGEAKRRGAIVVDSAAASTAYSVTIDGDLVVVTSSSNPTLNSIRDQLVAAINAAAAGLRATALDTGLIALEVTDRAQHVVSTGPRLEQKLVLLTLADGIATFSVDVFGDDLSVVTVSKRIEMGLEKSEPRQALAAAGWAPVDVQSVRKPDFVTGAKWESRSGFDVRMRCRMRVLEVVDWIADVSEGLQMVAAPV